MDFMQERTTEFIKSDDTQKVVGGILEDVILSCCCGCCAQVQVAREAEYRAGKVNAQVF